jgi:hypothetical protein
MINEFINEFINARRNGIPLTDEERAEQHYEKYGTTDLPPRGTGLRSLGMIRQLNENPESIPKAEIIGAGLGLLVGWFVTRKMSNQMLKYGSMILGVELGILTSKRLIR